MAGADDDPLPAELHDAVLARLGLPAPPTPDREGLAAVYRAWCARVPFDNVRKMIALRRGDADALPGGHAADFFAHWLEHGAGGTCWPSSNALHALLVALGFAAERIAGAMRDLGITNHASVRVPIGDEVWLVDSSSLTNAPLRLAASVTTGSDPAVPAEVEPDGGTHVVWTHTPPNTNWLPCRLGPAVVDHAAYLAGYEASRARSPFNQRVYARRNVPGGMLVVVGNTRCERTGAGTTSRELSPDELRLVLQREIGLSAELVAEWADCGGLAASFEPPAGPKPPPVTRVPPSQR